MVYFSQHFFSDGKKKPLDYRPLALRPVTVVTPPVTVVTPTVRHFGGQVIRAWPRARDLGRLIAKFACGAASALSGKLPTRRKRLQRS